MGANSEIRQSDFDRVLRNTHSGVRTTARWHRVLRASAALVLGLVGAVGVAPQAAYAATPPPWYFQQEEADLQVAANSSVSPTLQCPSGWLPISGGINSDFADYRRLFEYDDIANATYHFGVYNATANVEGLRFTVQCAPITALGPIQTVSANFPRDPNTHQAGGWVSCPAGTLAVGGGERWSQSGSRQINYAAPTDDGHGWYATGVTAVSLDVLHVEAYCIAAANLAGEQHTSVELVDPPPGELQEVQCPAGTRFLNGGLYAALDGQPVNPYAYAGRMVYLRAALVLGSWELIATTPNDPPATSFDVWLSAWCVPASTPAATITSGPPPVTNHTTATFDLAASDPVGYPLTATCYLDGVTNVQCNSTPVSVSGLTDGQHDLTFTVTNPDGQSDSADYTWAVDTAAPQVSLTGSSKPFTLHTSTTLAWSGTDNPGGSGIARYQVRERRAEWNAAFGPYTVPSAWSALPPTTTDVTASLQIGYDTCFEVRAIDRAGNTSSWTPQRCVAMPLDDRSLTRATTGWTQSTGSAFYQHTDTHTTSQATKLAADNAIADRIAVVATHCPTCGKIEVYAGATPLGAVNLQAATTTNRVISYLPTFSRRTATITITVTTSGKPVIIDGLGISPT